jgi:predicted regulator of Ras-like GTPase activity (Roadblock/LC7/MglB family)
MPEEIEDLLNEMKGKGIGGALVRVDGVPVHSTLALNELSTGLIASIADVSDALMKKMDDRQKQMELAFENSVLVIVPMGNYVFCGMVKTKEEKRLVLEYAEKARQLLGK